MIGSVVDEAISTEFPCKIAKFSDWLEDQPLKSFNYRALKCNTGQMCPWGMFYYYNGYSWPEGAYPSFGELSETILPYNKQMEEIFDGTGIGKISSLSIMSPYIYDQLFQYNPQGAKDYAVNSFRRAGF